MFEPKELVEIIGSGGLRKRKKCLVENDRVVIHQGGRGRGDVSWKPRFTEDCFIYWQQRHPYPPFEKVLKRKLMIKERAEECIHIQANPPEIPVFDIDASKKLMDARVIKSAGETQNKVTIPLWITMFIMANFGVGLILLVSWMRNVGF